jgi:hypothetical protein
VFNYPFYIFNLFGRLSIKFGKILHFLIFSYIFLIFRDISGIHYNVQDLKGSGYQGYGQEWQYPSQGQVIDNITIVKLFQRHRFFY